MAIRVRLQDIIEGMEWQSDETISYLNTRTGEVVTVTAEHLAAAEAGEADVEQADWERDAMAVARAIVGSTDYVRLPDRFEIDEYRMMERFANLCVEEGARTQLDLALRGSGAFRRFKDAVSQLGLAKRWYAFRGRGYEEVAIEWCQVHGIDFEQTTDGGDADSSRSHPGS
jgi:hypothetical protein